MSKLQKVLSFPARVSSILRKHNECKENDRMKKTLIPYCGNMTEESFVYQGEGFRMFFLAQALVCHKHEIPTELLWVIKNDNAHPEKILQVHSVRVNLKNPSFDDLYIGGTHQELKRLVMELFEETKNASTVIRMMAHRPEMVVETVSA